MATRHRGDNRSLNSGRLVLPPIHEETNKTKRRSLMGSETMSLFTSGSTFSPEMCDLDSDLEELASPEDDGKTDADGDASENDDNDETDDDKIQLSVSSEREIRQRAKEGLKRELKRIDHEAREKQIETRKTFKVFIDDARSQLIASRIEAEKVSINKLEERAEMQQAKIMKERAQRKKEGKTGDGEHYDNSKAHREELASLRKIQADLDRARARRKHSLAAALTTVNGRAKVSNLLQQEVKRLERAEEVHKIIVELYSLGLTDSAIQLTHSLTGKEESENKLREQLRNEKMNARKRAVKLMEDEIKRVRKECLSEMERKEQERLEKERLEKERREKEKREKEMANLKKMARNMERNRLFEESMFNTRVSRQFSFSYFPSKKK